MSSCFLDKRNTYAYLIIRKIEGGKYEGSGSMATGKGKSL